MRMTEYIEYLEDIARKDLVRGLRNLSALENIRAMLDKVDFRTEEISLTSEEKLIDLLTSLKEEPLTRDEKDMASMIIHLKKSRF